MTARRVSEELATATYDCPSSVAVGDWVYLSGSNSVTVADNGSEATCNVLGIVILKPTTIRAVVRSFGQTTALSGLTAAQRYWMGTAGAMTSTPPSSGVFQQLGSAITTTLFHIDIQQRVIL